MKKKNKEMQEQNQSNIYVTDEANEENHNDLKDKQGKELLEAIDVQMKYEMGHNEESKDGKKFVKRNKKKIDKKTNLLDESIEITQETLIKKKASIKPSKSFYEGVECERSFFFISKSNPVRIFIHKLTMCKMFEALILAIIVFSSIKLIVDTYLIDKPDDNPLVVTSNYLDLFFTVFFALESLIKAIASGFIMEKGSYLRESWNQLDFFIVVTSIIDLIFDGIDFPVIKILRLLRTLRPLRVISHNSGMKIVVAALIESVGHILNVLIVVLVVWLMFAILGVNLFGGKFQHCTKDKYKIRSEAE